MTPVQMTPGVVCTLEPRSLQMTPGVVCRPEAMQPANDLWGGLQLWSRAACK